MCSSGEPRVNEKSNESKVGLIETAFIFGGCGGFGKAFTRELRASGITVITSDRIPGAEVEGEISNDPEPFLEPLNQADLVLLCLPENAACEVLSALDGLIRDKLIVDICSVKAVIAARAESSCVACEYVSFHPMFGPERDFAGSNGVFMPIREGRRGTALKALLKSWDVNVIDCDVSTHDRVTSLVQVATHALLATFANLRAQYDVPQDLVQAFATPVFAELDRVSQGMVAENPDLYHNIQTANPWGSEARDKLTDALHETLATMSAESPEATRALFERVRRGKS